jgi:hypothetical protein
MTKKIEPCPNSPRNGKHAWDWLRDGERVRTYPGGAMIAAIGIYQCKHCPAQKEGKSRNGLPIGELMESRE